MSSIIVPMPLGGIFDRLIKLTGKTIGRTSIMTVIVLLPSSILFAFALDVFFSSVADLITEVGQTSLEELDIFGSLFGPGMFFVVGLIVQLLGILLVTLAASIIGVRQMTDERVSWQEALRTAWAERFLPALGQTVIQFLAVIGLFLVPMFLIMMGPFSAVSLLLGGLAMLVAIPFGIKLLVGWYFATTVIAVEDCGALDSLKRSSYLVFGQWWRVFGIVLLLGLIIQFAISLILTPIHFIALYGFFSKYIEMMGTMKPGVPLDIGLAVDPPATGDPFDGEAG